MSNHMHETGMPEQAHDYGCNWLKSILSFGFFSPVSEIRQELLAQFIEPNFPDGGASMEMEEELYKVP